MIPFKGRNDSVWKPERPECSCLESVMSSHDFDFGCDFQSHATGISAFMPPNPRFSLENKGQGAFCVEGCRTNLILEAFFKVVRQACWLS